MPSNQSLGGGVNHAMQGSQLLPSRPHLARRPRCPVAVQAIARPVRPLPRRQQPYQVVQPIPVGRQQQQQQAVLIPSTQQQQQQAQPQWLKEQQQQGEVSLSAEALTLVGLSTLVAFICSVDRAAMSVTILPMSEQFQWNDQIKGSVSSAFFAGYMVTNLCGGYLATRFSTKNVLALGVVLWSVFTVATPAAAASGSLPTLMLARGVMGVGEGVTYPSVQNLVRRWVPESQRSRALAFIYSGHQLGTIASYLLAPVLIAHFSWEAVFWIFGSLGFIWALPWMALTRNDTSEPPAPLFAAPAAAASPAAAAAALPAPAAAAEPALRVEDVPWGEFFRNPALWAIVAAQSTASVGSCLSFSWLPTFYNEVYGVDVMHSSAFTIIPFVATVLATNASGWIADGLVNNSVLDKATTRKLMQSIASFGPALVLVKLAVDQGSGAHSLTDAVAMITVWLALSGFSASGYGSNCQDISSKYSGILYGLSNGLASVAGSVSIYLTGQVLHSTHDWGLIFEAAAGSYMVGALAYLKWASCSEQFGGDEGRKAGAKGAAPAAPSKR